MTSKIKPIYAQLALLLTAAGVLYYPFIQKMAQDWAENGN